MQRVAIARALINRPSILLADEPTGNLDSTASRAILGLFARLRADHALTILLATHSEEAASFADQVLRLRDGAIAAPAMVHAPR
jgi:ABC-type lipoprotein export system ATPase subunit